MVNLLTASHLWTYFRLREANYFTYSGRVRHLGAAPNWEVGRAYIRSDGTVFVPTCGRGKEWIGQFVLDLIPYSFDGMDY